MGRLLCYFEFVAYAVNRMHILRGAVERLKLLSELLNMAIDGSIADDTIVRVYAPHKLSSIEYLAGLVAKHL